MKIINGAVETKAIDLSLRNDYKTIKGIKYKKAIEWLYDARKYEQISLFTVDSKVYYCVLVMRGRYLEPHFGVFLEDKFKTLINALKENDKATLAELIKDKEFIRKDGMLRTGSDLIKILSYVFSILFHYLEENPITDVKIMGTPRKFNIYKKMVENNLHKIPYSIIDEIDDEYTNKDGNTISAKALKLKYDFA